MNLHNADFRSIFFDGKFDLIFADLPYGKTRNSWDSQIPLAEFWESIDRASHPKTVVVATASQPSTSLLVSSNLPLFRYEVIWSKRLGSDFLNANRKPINSHESVLIFSKQPGTYNPQKTTGHPRKVSTAHHKRGSKKTSNFGLHDLSTYDSTERYPTTVWEISRDTQRSAIHPTQKPIELLSRIVLSYSNEGDRVLDPCMGSGTTGVACMMHRRSFTGIEVNEDYFTQAESRIKESADRWWPVQSTAAGSS